MAPIKVHGRFATAYDTAKTLGVSPARTRQLIKRVDAALGRVAHRSSRAGSFTVEKGRNSSSLTKNGHANRKASTRRAKSGR